MGVRTCNGRMVEGPARQSRDKCGLTIRRAAATAGNPVDGSIHCETDADHVRERATVEFFHDARLVDFDGPRADPELSRDVAVLTARRYECEDLSFAGSQALKAPRRSRPR